MTTPPPPNPSEERFERLLGNLLRVGVLTAAAVVLAGAVLYLSCHATEPADFKTFTDTPSPLHSPRGILADLATLHGRVIIQFGVLLLIATPVARVVLSVLGFARQRDWTYVALTLIVLAVLLYSLIFQGG